MSGYRISQTSLKDFYDDETCLEKWRGLYIRRTVPFISNQAIDYGKYFEYLCIGSSAKEDDTIVSLPLKKDGTKYVAQERIEQQAKKFKSLMDFSSINFKGMEIKDTQVFLSYEDEVGTLDIEAIDIMSGLPIIIDLKLTSDIDSTRTKYGFGHDENIDKTQAYQYAFLYEKNFGVRPEFKYYIFDYSTKLGAKEISVNITDDDLFEISSKKDGLRNFIKVNRNAKEWPKNPSKRNCESCPLSCEVRIKN